MKRDETFLNWIIEQAQSQLNVTKIYLYGSRARKTHTDTSDFDIAFDFPQEKESQWGTFSLNIQEKARTLRKLDLVNLRHVSDGIKTRILAEGEVIYASRQSQS